MTLGGLLTGSVQAGEHVGIFGPLESFVELELWSGWLFVQTSVWVRWREHLNHRVDGRDDDAVEYIYNGTLTEVGNVAGICVKWFVQRHG